MSKIQFIDTPFPDNHDGFDYSPKSFTDVQRDEEAEMTARASMTRQNKMLGMIASIFK